MARTGFNLRRWWARSTERVAAWAFRRLVRPHIVAFVWTVTGNSGNLYADDQWALAPEDVEVVFLWKAKS